jgi:hypothetical protein
VDSALQQRGHTEKLWCPIRRSPYQRLVGLFYRATLETEICGQRLWARRAENCLQNAGRQTAETITRRAGRGDLVLFPALGNHAGLQTSDLRSAGTRALDGAAASGSAVTAPSGYPIRKKGESRAPRCPLNVDSAISFAQIAAIAGQLGEQRSSPHSEPSSRQSVGLRQNPFRRTVRCSGSALLPTAVRANARCEGHRRSQR